QDFRIHDTRDLAADGEALAFLDLHLLDDAGEIGANLEVVDLLLEPRDVAAQLLDPRLCGRFARGARLGETRDLRLNRLEVFLQLLGTHFRALRLERGRRPFLDEPLLDLRLDACGRVIGLGTRERDEQIEIAVFLLGFAQRFLDLGGLELRLRLREILQKSRAAQLDEDVVGSDELPRENVHVLDDAFAAIGYGADFRRVQGARAGDLVHELPARDAPGPERAAVDAGRTPHEARGHAREEGERDAGGGESRPAAIAALARIRSLDIRGLPPERRSPSRLPM